MKAPLLLLFTFALAGCSGMKASDNSSSTTSPAVPQATLTCYPNQQGQLIDQYGRPCSAQGTPTCQTGKVYNPVTGLCQTPSAPAPTPNPNPTNPHPPAPPPTPQPTPVPVPTPTPVTTVSCDYWNQVYQSTGAYYVPMSTSTGAYCVNIANFVPDYQDYDYVAGSTVYGVSCPYDAYTCQYGEDDSGYWEDSSGQTCVGVGVDDGNLYGVSGFFGVCF